MQDGCYAIIRTGHEKINLCGLQHDLERSFMKDGDYSRGPIVIYKDGGIFSQKPTS
jgi:hypothetical protein